MQNIQLSYPSYFLGLCFIVAVIYAISLYYKAHHWTENKKSLPFWLSLLRMTSVFGLLFLLLMPFLKHLIQSQQDPVILIAEDNSQSISAVLDEASLSSYQSSINQLENALSEKFEVKRFSFGEKVFPNSVDSFNAQSTNISVQLNYLEDQYSDRNIGAIILASDGIFNEGNNPIYSNAKFKAPLHTIALGDTTIRRDLLIKNVLHNRIAYLGDEFNFQIDVQAFNASGSSSTLVVDKVVNGKSTTLKRENFNISSNNFFKTFSFNLSAADIGNVKYVVRLNKISDELSIRNNSKEVYVEILDARQKVLLYANAPNPDLAALKRVIELNKNYEVDIQLAKKGSKNLNEYDVVFLHNLPSKSNPITTDLSLLKSKKIPCIFVTGNQTDLSAFSSAQDALTITGQTAGSNEVQAIVNPSFNAYIVEDKLKNTVTSFPPLVAPFGEYNIGAKTEVLLYQKIGQVETKYPLLCYSDLNDWKVTVLAAEGIWKWKFTDYQDTQTFDHVSELINKMIQFTAKKADKRKFKAFVSKNNYKENEEIIFDAQLYNENYELINSPDAFLKISDNSGNNYNYTFSKTNNYYNLSVGLLPEGNYSYTATTKVNSKELNSKGKFTIQSIQKEQYDLTAKHDLLKSLSDKYSGSMFYPNEITALQDAIMNSETIKPVIYQRSKTESLMNMKWIFGLLGFLLILEWFLRRFYGSY